MGAATIHTFHLHGSMLVRRIVRLGSKFVCGICRTPHSQVHTANSCLYTCWHSIKRNAPFITKRRHNLIQYACIYCLRSYKTSAQACNCASDCSQGMGVTEYRVSTANNHRSKLELIRSNQVIQHTMKSVEPTALVTAKTVDHAPNNAASAGATAVVSPESAPTPDPTIGLPHEVSVESSDADGDKKKLRKAGRTKKFNRAGAKYVCEVCLEKYFTKNEVEKCFDAHPD